MVYICEIYYIYYIKVYSMKLYGTKNIFPAGRRFGRTPIFILIHHSQLQSRRS